MKPGTRVLIVEDDHSIARVVQLQLEHRGFSVRCCYDGISGLEEVPKFRPQVIVLDIMLPGLDGVGILKRLRSTGIRVPIIMLTARDTPMDKIHSLDHGADDYLTKPYDMGELMARIRALLSPTVPLRSRLWTNGVISREPQLSGPRALLCTICGTYREPCYWDQTPPLVDPATKSRCP